MLCLCGRVGRCLVVVFAINYDYSCHDVLSLPSFVAPTRRADKNVDHNPSHPAVRCLALLPLILALLLGVPTRSPAATATSPTTALATKGSGKKVARLGSGNPAETLGRATLNSTLI